MHYSHIIKIHTNNFMKFLYIIKTQSIFRFMRNKIESETERIKKNKYYMYFG